MNGDLQRNFVIELGHMKFCESRDIIILIYRYNTEFHERKVLFLETGRLIPGVRTDKCLEGPSRKCRWNRGNNNHK